MATPFVPRQSALAAVLLAALLGCGKDSTGTSTPPPPQPAPALALQGADVSALERLEQAGGVYRDSGVAGDAIAILRRHHATVFRLRLFVAPNGTEVQVNDLAYTMRMAQRVKTAGARLLLDIHYSDTWADPSHQTTPAAWAALGIDSLDARVERYTDSVVTALKQAGALPDIVQVGNEVDGGFLWPLGQVSYGADSVASWDRFARLLKAGVRGVHDALAAGDTVRVMVQYGQGGNAGGARWFFDHLVARGVPFDLVGLSYYPWWHGSLNLLAEALAAVAQAYGKDVVVVETSYPWQTANLSGIVADPAALPWGVTPAGQAQFLHDLLVTVAATPGSHGIGVVWWYPEAIQVSGVYVWGGGSLALFDANGNLLPAGSVFTAP